MRPKLLSLLGLVGIGILPLPAQDLGVLSLDLSTNLPATIRSLAVMPFGGPESQPGAGVLQERLTTLLVRGGKVTLVERARLAQILRELALGESGVVDPTQARRIGQLASVDALVTGSWSRLSGKQVEINGRVVEIATGRILAASRVTLEADWQGPAGRVPTAGFPGRPKVQLAVLLDTSSSMDGLIGQARDQIWKIVNELARSEREGTSPEISVALYEYGNSRLAKETLFIRQVSALTNDLDQVSAHLFGLSTSGGNEYCGAVLERAARDLAWDPRGDVYKAVFIAGNEPFTQGPVPFEEAVASAVGRGIYVNTIFCGRRQEGIATQWARGAELGNGDFVNIDQGVQPTAVPAPQDGEIQELNGRLNRFQIAYSREEAQMAKRRVETQDQAAAKAPASGAAQERSLFKANAQYSEANASWDMVSALESGKLKVEDIRKEDLPEELRTLKPDELRRHFEKLLAEKEAIRKRLLALSDQRRQFLSGRQVSSTTNSLDKAMIQSIRNQAMKKNFRFKE